MTARQLFGERGTGKVLAVVTLCVALAACSPRFFLLSSVNNRASIACTGSQCGRPAAAKGSPQRRRPSKSTAKPSSSPSPSSEAISITPLERTFQILWFALFIAFGLGMIACQLLRLWWVRSTAERFHPEWIFVGIAFAGAIGHTLFVDTKLGTTWEPIFDTTTLLWLAAAAAAFLYPKLSKINLPGFSLELQDAAIDASTVVTDALTITDKWATLLNEALCDFPKKSVKDLPVAVWDFLAAAAEDATSWLGKDKEYRRLAYWILDKNGELGLAVSNEITKEDDPEVCAHRFKRGVGLMGRALSAKDPINVADALKAAGFEKIPGDKHAYFGMLLVAIRYGKEPLGVIVVDRSRKEKFPDFSVKLIESLAAMTGMLLGEPTIREKLNAE